MVLHNKQLEKANVLVKSVHNAVIQRKGVKFTKGEILCIGVVYACTRPKNRRHFNRILMAGVSMKRAFLDYTGYRTHDWFRRYIFFFQFHLPTTTVVFYTAMQFIGKIKTYAIIQI